MAQELIFEWPQAVASGDAFNTTIADSWENLKAATTRETLNHGMQELLAYHLAGVEASTFTPRPTADQIAWMEATYTGDFIYNKINEWLRSQTGHEDDSLDDYILCKCNVELGYVTSGYSGNGLRIVGIKLIKFENLPTYPATLPSTTSETISGYQGNSKTVYYYNVANSTTCISGYISLGFGHGEFLPADTFSLSITNNSLHMTQGIEKTQRGGYFGGNRWCYVSGGYFSAINVISRDRYNPSGTSNSTSGKYPSTEMGGLGTFDDSTDLSEISTKPTLNIADLGFFSVWNPTASQLKSLAAFVWNDPTNWQQWPQIFQSGIIQPEQYIISLAILPIPSSALTLANKTFVMGGIPFNGGVASLGMSLTMNQVQEQFIDLDMGTVDLKEYFGSFLDYAPYSQVSLYLPYYQTVQLSMNELQNADSIHIVYRINLYDGSTAIKIHIDRQTSAAQNGSIPLKHVLYEFYTNVKTELPWTSGANTEQLKMLATLAAGAAATVAAPIAGAGASALASAAGSGASGGSMLAMAAKNAPEIGQAVSGAVKTGANAAGNAINSMPSGGGITRGNLGGMNNGLLSERRPYLIITRPIQVLPEAYREEMGYTASIRATIGTITEGYFKCDSVDTSGIACDEQERLQLIDLLTNEGVYV